MRSEEDFITSVDETEQNLRSLSIQVLSMVEKRVRSAFSGFSSSPIDIPSSFPYSTNTTTITDDYNEENDFNRIDRRHSKSSDIQLSTTPTLSTENDELPIYTLEEVSYHETRDDCWVIIYDRVYDITNFVYEHPGGEDVLLEYAGRDCTLPFRSVGHSKLAEVALDPYLIGILPEKERLWSKCFDLRVERR